MRYERLEDIQTSFLRAEQAIAGIARARYQLLADMRSGPARNDESFEQANSAHRGKLLFGFQRTVALVLSPAGQLQIQRYARLDQHDRLIGCVQEVRAELVPEQPAARCHPAIVPDR